MRPAETEQHLLYTDEPRSGGRHHLKSTKERRKKFFCDAFELAMATDK